MNSPTPTLISVVSADAGPDWVRIVWYTDALPESLSVQRRSDGAWAVVGRVVRDEGGRIRFEDHSVVPGMRYQYRLSLAEPTGAPQTFGEVMVDTPAAPRFALRGIYPNPVTSSGDLSVRFSLPVRERATLEVIDVQGRAIWRRAFASLDPGDHDISIDASNRFRAGVYFLRLAQGGHKATARLVVMH